MAVPNTTTFSLQDVVDEINPTTDDLNDCVNDAIEGAYDDTYYTSPATNLLEFRNYGALQVFYDGVSFAGAGDSIQILSGGTKMYMLETSNGFMRQYTLSTPWDVSSASYDSINFTFSGTNAAVSFEMNSVGTKIITASLSEIRQYTLSTAYVISAATYNTTYNTSGQTNSNGSAITLNSGGTKMYIGNTSNNFIYQYTLPTAYSLTSASYASKQFLTSSQINDLSDIKLVDSGDKVFGFDQFGEEIYQYSLTTTDDISTAGYDSKTYDTTSESGTMRSHAWKDDGTKFYCVNGAGTIYQYTCITPWVLL